MKRIIFLAALLATPATAQQQSPPSEQALGAKLMREVQDGLQCNVSLISVQAELAKAHARVKELESVAAAPK